MPKKPQSGIREAILSMKFGKRPLREIIYPCYVRLYPLIYRMREFSYDGQTYSYMFHPYGATIRGERIVEVPIALEALDRRRGQHILEVGNVLSHYVPCSHVILDKYEDHPACLNMDIFDFEPPCPLDFIVSVSTVEHIGWNEFENTPERAVQALTRMADMLAPGGTMLVTIPWGYNPALDRYLQSRECLFTELRYMRRVSRKNKWEETDAGACADAKYGEPFPFGNVIVFGYLTSQAPMADP